MYVLNDMANDSRVIREATTLGQAGHAVTVMATSGGTDARVVSREIRDGYDVVHVPLPAGRPLVVTWIRRPWRLFRWAALRWLVAVRAGPTRWPIALAVMVGTVVTLPWIVIRGSWYVVSFGVLKRPARRTWLDYVVWWRHTILGWSRAALDQAPGADVHHGHDMDGLPAAAAGARRDGARLVYDSHEVFMSWGDHAAQPWPIRAVVAAWERRLARRAESVVTINDEIAAELRRRLRVERTIVLHNTPLRWTPPDPPEDRLRRATGIAPSSSVVLCHGGFQVNRGLEETALAMLEPGLDDAHLVFLGYRQHVLERIVSDPRLAGRVHVLDAVPPATLLDWVAGADVDVIAIIPVDLNSVLSSPNKLFESLAAGVPVVSSDLPVRRRIICDDPAGPLGVMCDPRDPGSIAAAIRAVVGAPLEERTDLRRRCLAAAHARWNWETEAGRLVALYDDLARRIGDPVEAARGS